MTTPPAEVDVGVDLVRRLLADQHPDVAHLPLRRVATGWDNVVLRLGDDLAVRVPRRELAARLVEHEQRWLPVLAPRLPLPVPVPVRRGAPGPRFPWAWSVVPWFPGGPAWSRPPADGHGAAEALGRFLGALHVPAPPDAPRNEHRGVPLAQRHDRLGAQVAALGDLVDGPAVLARWAELVATPPWPGPPVWLHGDLHPGNLVVADGRLAAVVDFGDLTAGDPATDLAVAWMLLGRSARATLRAAAGAVDDATWARAQGWALVLGVAMCTADPDDPVSGIGRRTLAAALAG